jgi:hypothetical protein
VWPKRDRQESVAAHLSHIQLQARGISALSGLLQGSAVGGNAPHTARLQVRIFRLRVLWPFQQPIGFADRSPGLQSSGDTERNLRRLIDFSPTQHRRIGVVQNTSTQWPTSSCDCTQYWSDSLGGVERKTRIIHMLFGIFTNMFISVSGSDASALCKCPIPTLPLSKLVGTKPLTNMIKAFKADSAC